MATAGTGRKPTAQERALSRVDAKSDVLAGGARESFRRLGIGEKRGYELALAGKLPFLIRLNHTWICPRAAFELYLRGEFTGPKQPS